MLMVPARLKTTGAVIAAAFGLAFAAPASALAQARPDDPPSYDETVELLERTFTAFDRLEAKIDTSQFDIAAKVAALGRDPARIFEFVREEIAYEPYFGELRGAQGTLVGQAGNSVDQSVLLAAMLKEAGARTRFVRGELDGASAGRLIAQAGEARPTASRALTDDDVLQAAVAAGLDGDELARLQENLSFDAEDNQEVFWEEIEDDTALLRGLLDEAGVGPGARHVASLRARMRVEAREHVWLQVRDGDGWTDLDPSFRAARAGATFAAPVETLESLPDALRHTLRLRVTLRTITDPGGRGGGVVEDHVLLERTVAVADLTLRAASLALVPNVPLDPSAPPAENFPRISEFTPVLSVEGFDPVFDKSFDLRGTVVAYDEGSLASTVERIAAPVKAGFGGVLGRLQSIFDAEDTVADPPGDTWIGGVWVDYELAAPEGLGNEDSIRHFRRDIVSPVRIDRWSKDGRDAWATSPLVYRDFGILRRRLLRSFAIMPLTGRLSEPFLQYAQLTAITRNKDFLRTLAAQAFGEIDDPVALYRQPKVLAPTRSALFSMTRTAAADAALRARYPHVRSYANVPSLVVYEQGFDNAADGALAATAAYDIVTNRVRALPGGSADASSATDFQFLSGLIDSAVERKLGEIPLAPSAAAEAGSVVRVNTRIVFQAAAAAGIQPVVLRGATGALDRLQRLEIEERAKAEIAAELAQGFVVVVPERSVEIGGSRKTAWWRIAPDRTSVLGIATGGRGADLTETVIIKSLIIFNVLDVACLYFGAGGSYSCFTGAVAGAVGAGPGVIFLAAGTAIGVFGYYLAGQGN